MIRRRTSTSAAEQKPDFDRFLHGVDLVFADLDFIEERRKDLLGVERLGQPHAQLVASQFAEAAQRLESEAESRHDFF